MGSTMWLTFIANAFKSHSVLSANNGDILRLLAGLERRVDSARRVTIQENVKISIKSSGRSA